MASHHAACGITDLVMRAPRVGRCKVQRCKMEIEVSLSCLASKARQESRQSKGRNSGADHCHLQRFSSLFGHQEVQLLGPHCFVLPSTC